MVRLILFLLLLFLIYTVFAALRQFLTGRSGKLPPEKTRRGEDMVRDPQCGVYLPRSEAVRKTIGGRPHYFCSKECRNAFREKE